MILAESELCKRKEKCLLPVKPVVLISIPSLDVDATSGIGRQSFDEPPAL
jgi:hypothetical protein